MTSPTAAVLQRRRGLLTAAKLVRELLPDDGRFGDPLSTAAPPNGGRGRRLVDVTARWPRCRKDLDVCSVTATG